ncbi:FecR family protein [Parahaliea mediterranea]|uniref:FecR domain-containing protein n=1 Tax=Parahaliea mediterranea TaxID=651086 RepID=A0A939DGW4_9GAMM|nr:FecR domain-containing protein [Parahaliea mediterranea]MBN7797636.1 FecR domain-containing protein [Parahaliea mediterranea]
MVDQHGFGQSDVDKEACAWIAQFDGEEPTAADLEAFREWINRSPRHREAMERLSLLWGEMNVLTELAVPPRPRPRPRLFLPAMLATVAMALVVAIGVLWVSGGAGPGTDLYATAVGEQRTVALPDGSLVQLNTASRVRVNYDDQARALHLLAGEAYFDVRHDASRPFLVHVNGRTVRAVGTAFSVRKGPESIEVLVTDGVVELAERNTGGMLPASGRKLLGTVKRGQRVRLTQQLEPAEAVSDEEVARELAWRDGMLSFAGEPLALVIEEVGRYSDVRIVIEDSALSNMRIGGYFRAGDTAGLLDTLESGFPIDVDRADNGTVRLRSRK